MGVVAALAGQQQLARQVGAALRDCSLERLPQVAKNKSVPVVLVCEKGARAVRAEAMAKKLGYEKAQALAGGMKGWRDAGMPVVKA